MTPFTPNGATATITAANTTANVILSVRNANTVLCQNIGSVTVFIRPGTSSVTAAVTDIPLLANQQRVFDLRDYAPGEFTHIAAIVASSTAVCYFTPGSGGGLA